MDQRGVSLLWLLLLIAVAVASEPESFGENRVAGRNEEDGSLRTAPILTTSDTNATTTMNVVADVDIQESPASSEERKQQDEDEDEMDGEEDEENDGEEEDDEYEDELKTVAESHEAMSKDDTRNSNVSSSIVLPLPVVEKSPAQTFDSQEVIVTDHSDEDVASNEAITDEVVDKYDEEVAELLKYKKEKNSNFHVGDKSKIKRVPTVKKELSTQKEILVGSNETQLPKSLLPSEDTLNRLNDEMETVRRRNADGNRSTKMSKDWQGNPEGSSSEGEVIDNGYTEPQNRKKLDKRQETVLNDLRSYLLAEYATEEEQRQKLHELGAQEDALAENLLKLLVKLAENPSRWERVHKLLVNAENDLNPGEPSLDPAKRGYQTTSPFFSVTTRASADSRKSRKKLKKKKKKKPKHRLSTTTTMTPAPITPPLLTTTETSWQTTPVQWRLVAEKLFGPPWQRDIEEEEGENGGKVRYSAVSKPRTLPSIRELIEQNKSRSGSKTFGAERKSMLAEGGREGGERIVRFGKVNTHQPSHLQGHREFGSVYERPAEPDRLPNYDVADSYQRFRYNDLSPSSRDYLRRAEEDYQNDYNLQSNGFPRNHDYDREYPMSKSWPEIPYQYSRPWKDKWSWRQPQTDLNYWPQRNKYLNDRNYWNTLNSEENMDDSEDEKIWQQEQRLPSRPWERERLNGWPIDKPMKIPSSWSQTERSMKQYDQSNGVWEKSKNRSEFNKSKDEKEKIVLPQITMKTWNSLTSDPATWPYKLPGAKPWPKDENGKSYNPNADLVKKLGLDKQVNSWSKEETEDDGAGRKSKIEKQNRLSTSNESSKEEESFRDVGKYRSNERSNLSDYKLRSSENVKPWMMLQEEGAKTWTKGRESDGLQNDEGNSWRKKYEGMKKSWSNEDTVPKIQSVGAWVMSADQSTWKPYKIKPMDSIEDNSSPRRWSSGRASPGEIKWPGKENSWAEKTKDSWRERSKGWTGKSGKSNSWFAKTKEGQGWPSKSNEMDSWKAKGDPSWLTKPNDSTSWSSRVLEKNSWSTKENRSPWPMKSNESWTSKGHDDVSKYTGDSWQVKVKNDDGWSSKSSDSSWKSSEANSWPRKSGDQSTWNSKSNDLGNWQQKINDEWNYGKASSSGGTWPSRWKQFAYHRVTALPISKPGTTADATSSKSKNNAFVAVSAVSSPKYTGNDWRKNEEDSRNDNVRAEEQERGNNQDVGLERPIYAWKKDPGLGMSPSTKATNSTDLLENQLEALRQIDFWPDKENEAEKIASTTMQTTTVAASNATAATYHRNSIPSKKTNRLLETNDRQTISMK